MFAHKRLEWSLVYQSPAQSETEWLCVDVAGYKIITSTNLHTRDSYQRLSRRSHTPVCTLVTSTANMSTGATTIHLMTVRALTPGQRPTTLDCCMTQRKQPVFSLTDGTSAPGPGLREFQPGQQIAGQTCSRKVPTVTPSALHHNANKTQDSSPQRSGDQCFLKAEKSGTFSTFFGASWQKFWKLALARLDSISFTGENFTNYNFIVFPMMCGTFSRFKSYLSHSKDIQQWVVKKYSDTF